MSPEFYLHPEILRNRFIVFRITLTRVLLGEQHRNYHTYM